MIRLLVNQSRSEGHVTITSKRMTLKSMEKTPWLTMHLRSPNREQIATLIQRKNYLINRYQQLGRVCDLNEAAHMHCPGASRA